MFYHYCRKNFLSRLNKIKYKISGLINIISSKVTFQYPQMSFHHETKGVEKAVITFEFEKSWPKKLDNPLNQLFVYNDANICSQE